MQDHHVHLDQIESGSWRVRVSGGSNITTRMFRTRGDALRFACASANSSRSGLVLHGPDGSPREPSGHSLAQCRETEETRSNPSSYHQSGFVDEQVSFDQEAGRTRTATTAVLFVDIVGFSSLAASVTPAELMNTLQIFCARMEHCVSAHNGTLEKYLGDGLMATFGAQKPVTLTSAIDAVRCAESMVTVLNEWNVERDSAGNPTIRIAIGAHYGEVVLGIVGVKRIEFAVIGDCVNTASHLQTMASDSNFPIVISKILLEQAGNESSGAVSSLEGFVSAGECRLPGRARSIAVATHWRDRAKIVRGECCAVSE